MAQDETVRQEGSARSRRPEAIRNTPIKAPRIKTREDRLRFVLEFAQTDIDQLREGDLLNLRDDFLQFLFRWPVAAYTFDETFGVVLLPDRKPGPGDLSAEDYKELQKECLDILGLLPLRNPVQKIPPVTTLTINYGLIRLRRKRNSANQLVPELGDKTVVSLHGPTRDLFLWIVYQLLSGESASRIARCPGCETIYYQEHGKQKYCSRRCGNRLYMKEYRGLEGNRKRVSEKNHQRYERRLKRKTGSNVKAGHHASGKV